MQTINGIPTEIYQDVLMKGDLEVEGEMTFVNHNVVTYEGEVVVYKNEVVTY